MGKFLNLITVDFMEGVEEPWCNNQGVVVLPYVYQYDAYWFLLIKEKNPLFKNLKYNPYGSITGGCEKNKPVVETVINELLEETGIDVKNNKKITIHELGSYYANKTSTKLWHLYGVDLTKLELNIKKTFSGPGDGSIGEQGISGEFIDLAGLSNCNDALALAAYARLILKNIIT